MGITENWNLINRLIVPVIYQDDGFMGNHHTAGITSGRDYLATKEEDLGNLFGLGDIVYQGFFSPKKPGKIVWGLGPELHIPTGTERLTTNQWSLGPAAVVLRICKILIWPITSKREESNNSILHETRHV